MTDGEYNALSHTRETLKLAKEYAAQAVARLERLDARALKGAAPDCELGDVTRLKRLMREADIGLAMIRAALGG